MIIYNILKQKLELLDKSTVVLIGGHTNADYDSICSCIALAHILNKLGYTAYALIEERDMDKTDWINTTVIKSDYPLDQAFNFILLDANRKSRLGSFEPLFDKAQTTINIDHHEANKKEADYIFVDEYMSSTAEIIATLAKEYPGILDKAIATLLYAGIVSDTNSFYRRVHPSTMKIASMLMQYNVDSTFVVKHACRNMTLRDATILSHMLRQLTYDELHYIVLYRNETILRDVPYHTIFKKCASFVYDLVDINVFGLFLIELDGSISGLLRSNCNMNVDELARTFGGGGHKKAAGFETNLSIDHILCFVKEYVHSHS